jgi:hypothetical protein
MEQITAKLHKILWPVPQMFGKLQKFPGLEKHKNKCKG